MVADRPGGKVRCNDMCAMAHEFIDGVAPDLVAYAHPECFLHSPETANALWNEAHGLMECPTCHGADPEDYIHDPPCTVCPTCHGERAVPKPAEGSGIAHTP